MFNAKKTSALVIAWLALVSAVLPGYAAELPVEASVDPFISVSAYDSVANIGAVGKAGIVTTFPFAIESNSDRLTFSVLVTNLYKAAKPADNIFLAVDENNGVDFFPDAANPINGTNLHASYVSTEDLNKAEGIYAGHKSALVTLESTQDAIFQQDLTLSIGWVLPSTIMPSGLYRGYIVLYATTVE